MMTRSNRPTDVPEAITAVVDGVTLCGRVLSRGDVLVIDEQVYDASVDRNGNSPLAMSERQQVETHRRVLWVAGDRSKDIRKADKDAEAAREAARKAEAARDGRDGLADAWREEDRLAAAPNVFASKTTAGDGA